MRWIGKNITTHIVSLFVVFAVLTSFSLAETETLTTAITSLEGEDALFEIVYYFPEQAPGPAINKKADDSDYSIIRFANQRFFDVFGHFGSGSASLFSRFQAHSAECSFDNKSTIPIKLRI